MADFEMYNYWKRKYEEAYMAKHNANNRIVDIHNRKYQIISEINTLQAEQHNYMESQEGITKATSNNSDIDICICDTVAKLEIAADGFLAIGETSESKPQNLTSVFSERDSTQKQKITQMFEGLKTVNSSVADKISELSAQIKQLQSETDDGQTEERRLVAYIEEQDRMMNTAEVEMAYYS